VPAIGFSVLSGWWQQAVLPGFQAANGDVQATLFSLQHGGGDGPRTRSALVLVLAVQVVVGRLQDLLPRHGLGLVRDQHNAFSQAFDPTAHCCGKCAGRLSPELRRV